MNKIAIVLLMAAAGLLSQTMLPVILSNGTAMSQSLILVNFVVTLSCLLLAAVSVFGYVLYGRHLPEMPAKLDETLVSGEDPDSNMAQVNARMRTASKMRPRFSWGMLALLLWSLYHMAVIGILAYPAVWAQLRPAWLVW